MAEFLPGQVDVEVAIKNDLRNTVVHAYLLLCQKYNAWDVPSVEVHSQLKELNGFDDVHETAEPVDRALREKQFVLTVPGGKLCMQATTTVMQYFGLCLKA